MVRRTIAKHHRKLIWVLLVISAVFLILSPYEELRLRIEENIPWIIGGLLISESIFVIGIFIMATRIGYELGLNPIKWRAHLHTVAHHIPEDKPFWVGFWVNTIGAVGSGVIFAYGIIRTFPVESWGVAWIAFLDLSITFTVRAAVLELRNEYRMDTETQS